MDKHDDSMAQAKDIIFYDDDHIDHEPRDVKEQAVISIEKAEAPDDFSAVERGAAHRPTWYWMAIGVATSVLLCVALYAGWRYYNYYYNIGVPVSVSPADNIAKLAKPYPHGGRPEVVVTADSVFGVAINMYELNNLQAEISLTEPDSADASVWMYSRCADHTSDNQYLGSLVMNGKELASDVSRLGYCAMADGNIVIGVSRSDKVKGYVESRGGSFFRQFILISNGVLPPQFQLHGKVERRALARMANDKIYYIETRHPETLWDFADALREYGFVDAIYITGGKCHSYYRSPDGQRHSIGDEAQHPHEKYQKIVPWIVFKAR